MRLTVIAIGSRGDVQPYVALGEGLAEAGYEVRIATHEPFAPLLEGRGLEFYQVGEDPAELFANERIHSMLSAGTDALKFMREFRDAGPPPVYVGFGSMVTRDPEEATGRVIEALRRTGQRGILLTGSGATLPATGGGVGKSSPSVRLTTARYR